MNNKIFLGLLILAAGVLVGWYVLKGPSNSGGTANNPSQQQQTTPSGASGALAPLTGSGASGASDLTKGGVTERTVVAYTDLGFAPSPVTVKQGTTVTFVNNSSRGMWVASDVHPTHLLLPGFDELSSAVKGGTYDYTFVKVGTWTYHNHVNPSDTGSVTVTK
ncbi:hypothetical protein A2Z00_00945 [Candidatus Gottesmanbacteria bacterium RBG_13_45_10]|uniref:EfeO-type cupredoxin-like domain-containing protein n=1 Tax=Candidatus Gottesmanbacteria bacterium RBG_13_45_10 TaxID=1798370 RepID=A0A1F5ZHT5_9BACT|nr:MAG: hypothetical protein A2Z00_00945 [Candidatus Gottesmanbacteria bacterium RBG_13_45_10]